MKHYKFQALVTLFEDSNGQPQARPGPAPRRMVLRSRNEESRHSQVYTALVSCDDDGPFRRGSSRWLVTLRVAGDDVADCLDIGGHFDLWPGSNVGEGTVTRRLFA